MTRLFFAIRVPSNKKIDALLHRIDALRGIKPVEPENIHYTLRYLGNVPPERRDRLVSMLENAQLDMRSFTIEICGTATFPATGKPSVVWLGCTPESGRPLETLAGKVDAFADEIGLDPRDRPFVPHLTVARVKRPDGRSVDEVKKLVAESRDAAFGSFRVETIQLVESQTTERGPVYTNIAEVRFG